MDNWHCYTLYRVTIYSVRSQYNNIVLNCWLHTDIVNRPICFGKDNNKIYNKVTENRFSTGIYWVLILLSLKSYYFQCWKCTREIRKPEGDEDEESAWMERNLSNFKGCCYCRDKIELELFLFLIQLNIGMSSSHPPSFY